jgi:aspartate kinase
VGDPARIRRVAERVCRYHRAGHELVVVVSAMGDTTDELEKLARQVSDEPGKKHPREMDMLLTAGERISMALLAMAIREAGVEAISFTGSQAAIITDMRHTGARIEEIRADRIRQELEEGRVVIVAGFQGVSRSREVTTLGRGGSDTTAVALAAALGSERCDIFTDVDGVYTADPRVIADARRIPRLDYDEMTELAVSGARVLHPRAVELGARFQVPMRVLSSLVDGDDAGGTLIAPRKHSMEDPVLSGVASEGGYAKIILRNLPAEMASMTRVLDHLSEAGVSVDLLSQMDTGEGGRDIQLTLREDEVEEGRRVCDGVVTELGGSGVDVARELARITLVGSGMHKRPGVYARAFRALNDDGVAVHAVSASSVSIILMVDAVAEERALRVIHDTFELGEEAG